MKRPKLSREEIEQYRDLRFRRVPGLRLKQVEDVLDFVNGVGFCFAFAARNSELPCAWHAACGMRNPVLPRHIQHDETIGLIWSAKDDLPAAKKLYYGKAIKRRPTFISLDFFPYFYSLAGLSGEPEAYVAQYLRGELSPVARRIMDALSEKAPMVTAELKIASGFAHPRKRYQFDQGMAELQAKFHVVKIGEFYDPFTFLWDLVSNRFVDEIEIASTIEAEAARICILKKYLENLLVSNRHQIQKLFGWAADAIQAALDRLEMENNIYRVEVNGEKGDWYCWRPGQSDH